MKTKALAYLRVSGKSQRDGDGLTRQRLAIEAYAKAHKVAVVGEYADVGVSGKASWATRPALLDALAHLDGNGIKTILVEDASRLSRDVLTGELALQEFRKRGVVVLSVKGGNGTAVDLTASDDAGAKLIRQILAAVGEHEKDALVAKLRAARERTGRMGGVKPFGTKDGEATTLARLRQLARKRKGRKRPSAQAVADKLNEEGLPTRSGKPWSRKVVGGILKR